MSNGEWVPKEVHVPEGAYLASSHETPGAERALLFDRESGNNLGPAELRDSERLTDAEIQQLMAICVAVGTAIGSAVTLVVAKGPEMKRGLDEKVLPAIKAKWTAFRARKSDSPVAETEDEPSNTETRRHLTVVKDEDAAA